MTRRHLAVALALMLGLAACGNSDPLATPSSGTSGGGSGTSAGETPSSRTIVIGSQDYYSNEIIAEIYAQALEAKGYTVDRQFRIGQREAYVPELQAGRIDLFPEYTGPLLEYWKPDTTARKPDQVYDALQKATPQGLRILDQSPATDENSYTVTEAFAANWGLKTIGDLKKVTQKLTLGANSEGQTRPYGPKGLKEMYDVTVDFTPIEDGGGPLTVKALKDGSIQLAIIYTADPSIKENELVSLEDPEGLFLSSHVVPVVSSAVDEAAAELINGISAAMSAQDLIDLNARSVKEELPAATIAKDWLVSKGLG